MEIPVALAFTAGLVATVNPCGFAMLPAYLALFLGLEGDDPATGPRAVGRALRVGLVVSTGFVVVFAVAGALLTLGVQAVVGALPWAAIAVGVGVAALGVAMLAGVEPRVRLPQVGARPANPGLRGLFVFGVSYAVASLSCTLPIFLVVVAGTIPQLGFVAGALTFVVYGLGMAMLLMVVTLAVALGRQAVVGWLRRSSRHVPRAAGAIMVLAGGYIVWFWATSLAGGGLQQGTAVVAVERASSVMTNLIGDAVGLVALLLAGILAAAGAIAWWAGRRAREEVRPTAPRRPPAG
jgi:cytochrome c-type biogenesis protein